MIETVGIVARLDLREVLPIVERAETHLQKKGVKTILESTLAKLRKSSSRSSPLNRMEADLIIAIGGDGTLLKTCLNIPRPETPILAVNMGKRGFLTEVEPQEMLPAIDRCIEGDYVLERCLKLSSFVGRRGLPDALNDFLVASASPSKVLGIRVTKDGLPIVECYCDGLIVATPTGSTAHSLSAGGSVLDPGLDAFILTPNCPLMPTPSIIIPSKSTIQIQPIKLKTKARISIDGQYQTTMTKRDTITIKKSMHYAGLVRFGESFYRRLRSRSPLPADE